MEDMTIDPPSVVALADAIEDQKTPLRALGTRQKQAAQPINSGATDVDDQTRAVAETMNQRFARVAATLETVVDELDSTVRKYIAANEQAAADQRALLARLQTLAPQDETAPTPGS